MDTLKLGQIIEEGREANRDATHIAVAPVIAHFILRPGEHVGVDAKGVTTYENPVGIIDPFLRRSIEEGERCWLYLYPGSITSLRHEWTHPAFAQSAAPADAAQSKSFSETWMRAWALMNMGEDYYGEGEKLDPDTAYRNAIEAGSRLHVGPYEDARDSINDEWWNHWEAITGEKGERGEYFSCSC